MPQHPRQHQLETEFRLAFETALGSRHVYRTLQSDYGIDGEVEHFDETSGRATGARFFVQLKATDESDLVKALRVSVPLTTANYYRSQPVPVLMVRFHAPSGRLFTRWFHAFDPYYGGVGERSLTFRWAESDAWDDERPATLLRDVRAFMAVRSPAIPLPIPLLVETAAAARID